MLPVWELSGNETFCMIGYHSIPVIVDAYQKGISGLRYKIDVAGHAFLCREQPVWPGLLYEQYGYISNDKEHESASKTMEYAYDDWCIAQFAKHDGTRFCLQKIHPKSTELQKPF